MLKESGLLPETALQPHQQKLVDLVKDKGAKRILLMHGLGSGKSLSGIAMAEALGKPYTSIVPASLRENIKKEYTKFTDEDTPKDVKSYTGLAKGDPINNMGTVIFDEAHRLRNTRSKQTVKAQQLANKADQVILLSGTPIINEPSDLASIVNILTGSKISPQEFDARYVKEKKTRPSILKSLFGIKPGIVHDINRERELKAILADKVDYYEPAKSSTVSTNQEEHEVEMTPAQANLYNAIFNKLNWSTRWKLKNDYPLSKDEFAKLQTFMSGPRQVSLSTLPFLKEKDLDRAYNESSKLQLAHKLLKEKLDQDPRHKALVFSNFIDAGLHPYSAALTKDNIPHAVFHGGLDDVKRKKLIDDFNNNRLRVALLGPSGAEGLSFKGTQLVQLLDPYWNSSRTKQQQGRGLRFDSHDELPDELKNVLIQRFVSKLPMGTMNRWLSNLGFNRSNTTMAADDILKAVSVRKDRLNAKFYDILKEIGGGFNKKAAEGYRDRVDVYGLRGNKLLTGLRPDGSSLLNVFGGGIEEGETPEQAAVRELAEESGYTLKNPKLLSRPPLVRSWPDGHKYQSQFPAGQRTYFVVGDVDHNVKTDPSDPSNMQAIKFRSLQEIKELLKQRKQKSDFEKAHLANASKLLKPNMVDRLKEIKKLSDESKWDQKHDALVKIINEDPTKWHVDSTQDKYVGVEHLPTRFRYHMPKSLVPLSLFKELANRRKATILDD